ncbi:phosphatidylinositol glycan, class T [Sporothrix schenckii 1099-18]|uniref:Phosphatidylinositol glycan, class T n=1 Tax=Sporothrix schenckii 1099-18 TaxID=1397361 RepID=A0A0F2LUU5_SPOSC|nr:phosphatidylinositol glycan, class T [Sporothrix schenckii 1099-18]KJR80280.1 phosphatidylinositol glycan, class T [Sporothrix schenckii 1099-18]
MRRLLSYLLCLLASCSLPVAANADAAANLGTDHADHADHADYYENLVLRPLPLSALLASFNFRSNTTLSAFEAGNFRFFPRSIGQILQYAGTRELHLRFSLGRWDAESWGARPWAGTREGGTGVELWAWLDAQTDDEADEKWLTLTNALSGLFCASLNFIDGTRTTRPVMSFEPEGDHPANASMQLLYGTLPREVVCTENLTPFLKLLPCKGKAGIASLLDGHKLFDASWQSMAIDVRPICPHGGNDGECVLQIEQSIDMVLDIERSKRPRDNPIPRPLPGHELKCDTAKAYHDDDHVCFPANYSAHQDWSLTQIFGKAMRGTCTLADPATPPVCLEVPDARSVYVSEAVREAKNANGRARCFFFGPDTTFEVMLPNEDTPAAQESAVLAPETPLLYAERSLTGHGAERGGVQTILTNPSPDTEVEFVYMESLLWFMRIYLHTLSARLVDAEGSGGQGRDVIQDVYYRPALDRARGTQLEVRMRIPPGGMVFLTYDFEKSILRYTEYPPDANRGFDVAAAVITILHPPSSRAASLPLPASDRTAAGRSNLRTTTLLLSLPTPDFSMPYNVIIFTSTAIALAFGGMFNIIVRRFVAADEGPTVSLKAVLGKLVVRVLALANKTPKTGDQPVPETASDAAASAAASAGAKR